ncbi:unnamed protein product, partial [Allacma fusca]
MDFIILEKILNGLQLPVDYLQKFRVQCLDDKTIKLTLKDEDLKEELRHIVPVAGHRIAISSSFKKELEECQIKCSLCDLFLERKWDAIWSHFKRAHKFNTRSRNNLDALCAIPNLLGLVHSKG